MNRTHLTRLVILFEKWRDLHNSRAERAEDIVENESQATAYGHCAAMLEQVLCARSAASAMTALDAELAEARKDEPE